MLADQKSRLSLARYLIVLGLVTTVAVLVGCASTTTPDASTPDVTPTGVPLPAPTLEVRPSPTPSAADLTGEVQPSPTPRAPDAAQTPEAPPGLPLVVRDFRDFFPTAPPGFGELANHLIFYSNRSVKYQLYQVALDGSGLVQLTQHPDVDVYNMEPAWSTDGKIAFTSNHVNGSWELFVLYPDILLPTQLTDWGADSWSLAWSPDGRSLAFVSNVAGDDEIYLLALDGTAPVNLTQRPDANDFLPVWSPDGQQIAFVSDRVPEQDQDIYVMAPDGSGVTRLTEAEGWDTSPSWSPDGSKIAFVSERDENFEVYLMNPDGSDPVRLTNSSGYEWSPTWSPDGQLIAFTSTRNEYETYDVYIMAPDGSNQTRLTTDPANDIIPRWWP